eukprot:6186835-Pleurochrysis_carterae.AAC.1
MIESRVKETIEENAHMGQELLLVTSALHDGTDHTRRRTRTRTRTDSLTPTCTNAQMLACKHAQTGT